MILYTTELGVVHCECEECGVGFTLLKKYLDFPQGRQPNLVGKLCRACQMKTLQKKRPKPRHKCWRCGRPLPPDRRSRCKRCDVALGVDHYDLTSPANEHRVML